MALYTRRPAVSSSSVGRHEEPIAANRPPRSIVHEKPVILVFVGWSDAEASGVLRSVLGMVDALGDEFRFCIVTRRKTVPFERSMNREKVGAADVTWLPMTTWGPVGVTRALRETPHDAVMLSGFFDCEFTLRVLLARRLKRIPMKPVILSPYGELEPGALSIKHRSKRVYIRALRAGGLLNDLWFHASDDTELRNIVSVVPGAKGYFIANDIAALRVPHSHVQSNGGFIRLVFLSRICRKKNLAAGLSMLTSIRTQATLDIYGPIEDREHWRECEAQIAALPQHVSVSWKGEVANAEVARVMASSDLFFLPTLGENFGHAIFEALSCGVPVLISDRTPWRNLAAQRAGWELPLDNPKAFAATIDKLAGMGAEERAAWRRGARALAERFVAESDAVAKTRAMFDTVLGGAVDGGL